MKCSKFSFPNKIIKQFSRWILPLTQVRKKRVVCKHRGSMFQLSLLWGHTVHHLPNVTATDVFIRCNSRNIHADIYSKIVITPFVLVWQVWNDWTIILQPRNKNFPIPGIKQISKGLNDTFNRLKDTLNKLNKSYQKDWMITFQKGYNVNNNSPTERKWTTNDPQHITRFCSIYLK